MSIHKLEMVMLFAVEASAVIISSLWTYTGSSILVTYIGRDERSLSHRNQSLMAEGL